MKTIVTSGNISSKVSIRLPGYLKDHDANTASDGYVSFPDFENFHQEQNPYNQHREHNAVKT